MKVYESSEKGEMVMTKIFRILALLAAASLLLWIAGCGGDDDDDECAENVPPTVTLSPAGGDVFANTNITATCSKVVDSLTVSTGAAATSSDNKIWTFNLAEGNGQAVTVTATDACGETGEASGTYDVGAVDPDPPELVGGDCEPEDGDDGVDPADVEEILLVFNEDIATAEVQSFEPDANVQATPDGAEVLIEFLGGFSLGNEQEVVVEIKVTDFAGNEAEVEYSFTTMAKEE
jgi:hypothetical protein